MIIQLVVNGVLMNKIERKFQKNLISLNNLNQKKRNTQNISKKLLKKNLKIMLALPMIFGYVLQDKRLG